MNVVVSVQNQMIGIHIKMIMCGIAVRVYCGCKNACNIDEYCKKPLFGKVVLGCEDDKKVN